MKKILILLLFLYAPMCLPAQALTIGKTRDQIKDMVKATPAFKLHSGESCDTLVFQMGMQTIFYYKDDICYSSKSILPVMFMNDVVQKMTTDSYVKVKDNVWRDAGNRIEVVVTVGNATKTCTVVTTRIDDTAIKN
jgi:hypothetical protein